MNKNSLPENDPRLQSTKGLVDAFFKDIPNTPVQQELWKWFVFAVSGKGITISDLQADEFAQFSDQLIKLVDSVYHWANLQRAAAPQGEGSSYA